MMNRSLLGWMAVALGCAPVNAPAATPLTTERVASALTRPVYVTHAPGDFTRIFVVEQPGRIRVYDIVQNPPVLIGTFLDIQARVNDAGNEQGLLGMAFHPNFAGNNFFYVNYTSNSGGATRISRFTVPIGTPNVADPNSELILLTIAQPESNHNGGWIDFGPNDGYLYIGMGDGGGGGDVHGTIGNGQDINALLGKMLRIDVDGNNGPGGLYGIPPSNPFVGIAGADEIWSLGLRNPWRNAFDQLTGDLYIADVGQNAWEEIDFQPAAGTGGENWGWRCREGAHNFNFQAHCSALTLLDPIHEFSHGGSPFRCSITGGEVYRGCAVPDLQGTYFFADYCSNQIWSFVYAGSPIPIATDRTVELAPGAGLSITSISGFGRDAYGEIYICDLNGGEVFRIIPSGVPNACFCDPGADADSDSFNDCADNCPNTANALQSDVDLDTDGDLCDPCPAAADNICLAPGSTAAEIVASVGGVVAVPDGSVSLDIQPGDLSADGTLSITSFGANNPVLEVDIDGTPGFGIPISSFTVLFQGAGDIQPGEMVRFNGEALIPPSLNNVVFIFWYFAYFDIPTMRWKISTANNTCQVLECPPGSGIPCAICIHDTDHFSDWAIMGVVEPPAPPLPAPVPHDRMKNRYVSFVPNNGASPVAFRVRKTTAPGGTCWAGVPDAGGNAPCVGAPVYRLWPEPVVHVGDCEIVPVAGYEIEAVRGDILFSPPLTVNTIPLPALNGKFWGDIVGVNDGSQWTPPNQLTNVHDVVGMLAYINSATVKPTFQQVNLEAVSVDDPCLNANVNTADVFILVKAVATNPYPFTTNPAACGPCP